MAQFNAADAINAGTGIYSLVRGLTTRRPGRLQATQYKGPVRAAAGDPEGLLRKKNDIAAEAAAANRDVTRIAGSDVNMGIQARLGIQRNATQALSQAEGENTRLLREDQARQDQQIAQQEYTNAMLRNQASQANWEQDQQRFAQTQAGAIQGVNSSLNYITQQQANKQNNEIMERRAKEGMESIRGSLYQDAYVRAIVQGMSPEEARNSAYESLGGLNGGKGAYPRKSGTPAQVKGSDLYKDTADGVKSRITGSLSKYASRG